MRCSFFHQPLAAPSTRTLSFTAALTILSQHAHLVCTATIAKRSRGKRPATKRLKAFICCTPASDACTHTLALVVHLRRPRSVQHTFFMDVGHAATGLPATPEIKAASAAPLHSHPPQWPVGHFPGAVSAAPSMQLHPTGLVLPALTGDYGTSMSADPPSERRKVAYILHRRISTAHGACRFAPPHVPHVWP